MKDLTPCSFNKYPKKVAFIFQGQKVTFSQIEQHAQVFSERLRHLGLQRGDRVAIYLPNSLDFIYAYLGILYSGCIAVPLNVMYRSREVREIMEDSETRALISSREQLNQLSDLLLQLKESVFILDVSEPKTFSEITKPDKFSVPVNQDDLAAICYTSGTTGPSKGAMLSHGNFASNIETLIRTWEWSSQDIFLLTLPMFHMHGLGVALHGALTTGCTTILMERFETESVLKTIQEEKCTLFMGVPTMYARLLQVPQPERFDLTSMRLFVSGSAPLSSELFYQFKQTFGFEILERYGLTETIMNVSNPYRGKRKPGSVGFPLTGIEIRMVNKDGSVTENGKVGEITVKGPNVFKGYWRRPEATGKILKDGWMYTGDLGYQDQEGYIHIAGRAKDLIITGGFNVYPREVEEVLSTHPAVKEAVVVGIPDKIKGELVKAYVVLFDSGSGDNQIEENLISYCNKQLANFKVPRKLEFVQSLPRTASGKVITRRLPNLDA